MILLAVAACSTTPTPAASGAAGGSAGAPPSTGQGGAGGGPTAGANIVVGPGDFTLLGTTEGLDALTSYTARLTKTFTGTVAGTPTEWSVVAELSHADSPLVNGLTVETTGKAPDSPGRVVEVGGIVYAVPKDASCVAGAEEADDIVRARAELARLLPGVIGAEKVDASSIDGIAVDHYRFDERAVGLAGLATVTGELWVATAGYIVRYTLAIEGDAAHFGTDTSGTAAWEYVIRDINAPISVQVPATCPAGLVNAPLLDDASAVSSAPGVLTYVTARDIKAVMTFYEGKAAGLGWTRSGEPLSDESLGVLEYSSPEGAVTVFVTSDGGSRSVRIVIDPGSGG